MAGQLLGWLGIVPIVAVLALIVRQYWLALAIVIVGVAKLVFERVVKAVVTRERPATSIGADINTRGDVSITGESFVSGHAILVAAVATVVAPYVPPRGRIALGLVVVFVMFARVYVGAHNPLDVICGAGLGVALGAAINIALGAPRRSAVAKQEVDDPWPDDLGCSAWTAWPAWLTISHSASGSPTSSRPTARCWRKGRSRRRSAAWDNGPGAGPLESTPG